MKTTYTFKEGYRGKIEPAAAARELERIRKANKGLTAIDVVEAARPEDAALHPQFEWDDSAAAEQYRRDQARRLIRAVVEEVETGPPRRVYASITTHNQYERLDVIVQHEDKYASALANLQKEVADAQASLRELAELAESQGADPDQMMRLTIALETASALKSSIEAIH